MDSRPETPRAAGSDGEDDMNLYWAETADHHEDVRRRAERKSSRALAREGGGNDRGDAVATLVLPVARNLAALEGGFRTVGIGPIDVELDLEVVDRAVVGFIAATGSR